MIFFLYKQKTKSGMLQGLKIWVGKLYMGAKNLGGRAVREWTKIWEGVRPPCPPASNMPGSVEDKKTKNSLSLTSQCTVTFIFYGKTLPILNLNCTVWLMVQVNQTIENNLVAEKILVLYFWPSDDILREFLSHIKVNTFIFCLGFNYIPKKHEFQWIKIKIESDLKTSVLKLTRSLRL